MTLATRPSGRAFDQLRDVRIERQFTKHAEGSVLISFGDTRVLCTASVESRVPGFLRGKGEGWVTAEYGMLPRSTNERMNQFMLGELDKRAWRAEPPGGKGRTIAAIVAHVHNVRHMWLVVSAKEIEAPPKLDRAKVTLAQSRKALAASSKAMLELLRRSIANGGRVKEFKPDVVGFLCYSVAHEAHHRL